MMFFISPLVIYRIDLWQRIAKNPRESQILPCGTSDLSKRNPVNSLYSMRIIILRERDKEEIVKLLEDIHHIKMKNSIN